MTEYMSWAFNYGCAIGAVVCPAVSQEKHGEVVDGFGRQIGVVTYEPEEAGGPLIIAAAKQMLFVCSAKDLSIVSTRKGLSLVGATGSQLLLRGADSGRDEDGLFLLPVGQSPKSLGSLEASALLGWSPEGDGVQVMSLELTPRIKPGANVWLPATVEETESGVVCLELRGFGESAANAVVLSNFALPDDRPQAYSKSRLGGWVLVNGDGDKLTLFLTSLARGQILRVPECVSGELIGRIASLRCWFLHRDKLYVAWRESGGYSGGVVECLDWSSGDVLWVQAGRSKFGSSLDCRSIGAGGSVELLVGDPTWPHEAVHVLSGNTGEPMRVLKGSELHHFFAPRGRLSHAEFGRDALWVGSDGAIVVRAWSSGRPYDEGAVVLVLENGDVRVLTQSEAR